MRELITRLRNNRTVSNSGWLIWGKIAQLIISFFVGIFTARYLGPSNYGVLNTAIAYTTFVTPFCTLGISNIIVKEFIENPYREGEILGSGIGIRIITSCAAICVLAGVVYVVNPDNRELQFVSLIYSVLLIFKSFDLFEYWYQAHLISRVSANIGILAYVITSIFRIWLLATKGSIYLFAFAYVLDFIITVLLYIIYNCYFGKIKIKFKITTALDLLTKSYHYILSAVMVVVYAQMDKIMIGKMENSEQVGLYSVAVNICQLWTFVLQAIIDSARPGIIKLQKKDKALYQKRIIELYSLIIWISISVSIIFCVLANVIIKVLYGANYAGAVSPLRIITWYSCFSFLGVARNIWSVCEEKQKYEKYFALSGAICNTVLNLALIPVMGICGAALASLLTQIVTNVLVPFYIKDTRENAIFVLKGFNIKYIYDLFREV